MRSYSSPVSRQRRNRASMPTEMLKFAKPPACLQVTNSSISGCEAASTPIFAPLRRPPCLTASVAVSKTRMNETGPLAAPMVPLTMSPRGRRRLNENPVPPPDLWMSAMWARLAKIPSRVSSTGRTKQAESCPMEVPAFIRVGEFGRKRRLEVSEKNSRDLAGPPTAPATREKRSCGVSPGRR